MDKAEGLLLETLRCAILGTEFKWNEMPEQETLRRLFRLAREQSVLPLVADMLLKDQRSKELPIVRLMTREARRLTLRQASRTADFLLLLDQLKARGLRPLVLKGVVCRSLYPQPEQRPSADEDLLIPPEAFPRYHEALLACGLRVLEQDLPAEGRDEISYVDPSRDLYLELHLHPFPLKDAAYGDCNRYFTEAFDHSISTEIYGQTVCAMEPTDHLLYMICHAYKHMLYGGVGVRQICDICLFAAHYDGQIDWQRLSACCEDCGIMRLCAAFFLIGERHLGIPAPASMEQDVDELPLLEDCLSGGVYGAEDSDRLHSSRITLETVAAAKQGKAGNGLWKSLFPGKAYLKKRFPYAAKHPWLLPAAWAHRIWLYLAGGETNASRSLQIGRERIELLKEYRIIPRD